ncbi:MAG: SURF1 family cytochrome oxidase biogenesis protein [Brevibacterium aurantiacum]|uniref:SURF1-like protein n=1 Tax=Brevibacterium aurantiacum TaxID=273384 RepID=A0A2A3X9D1_BREAU|nr:SURF1 family protein [Brevibacterium aurantiacum]MDN5549985.1 SURF1 family protein [Brevibacterium sp.]AZL09510.1 SURF1 family protein [Brevibacterium aurantiacum]AZL13145.1 SURF1 family protein [Brevibacterium aurantiacum]AZT97425.1 SURF1 family protein [Brevibacterium aurantiacum]MDN5594904.1 SURF1 family protein [Brevibacterium sp.]
MARYSFLFSPRWLKYIAMTIIVVIACIFLALWQKDRREQREHEIDTINANYSATPVDIDSILPSTSATLDEEDEWRQVSLTGHYQTSDTVFARNRTVNDKVGYYVVVPFELTSGDTIAIVRGWVAEPDEVPPAPSGEQTINARLQPAQDGSEDKNPDGLIKAIDPARIPGMDSAYDNVYAEAVHTGNGLPDESGLTPLPAPDLDPGNHLSYMLQWFTFGIMIIIAVSISARRERRADDEAAEKVTGDVEYVVIDKAALGAGAKISQPGNRYGRNRLRSASVHGRAEAEEDEYIEDRFRHS